MSQFTARVDNLLQERKIKRADLCRALSLADSTYRQWIKGSIPNAEIALKVASFLNVSLEYLITGEGKPPASDLILLSDDENEIIDIYRSLDKRGKETLLTMAKGLEGVK